MEEELQKTLRRLMNDLTDTVALGGAKSFEEYNRLVGQIEGLAIAERELLTLMRSTEESEL
ncbi:MAG: hypothetical protein CMA48_02505 [Euryarchaeota archaeon]|jgi:hypothetical protein|nr:hypothetical protein [Euryarchaeota archaeon]|tara:strand:- start:78 stop:260 length:183 start_codon:yes stop_codon:yes gene_type:complete